MTFSAAHWTSPVLQSVLPVVEHSTHVATSTDAIDRVARWMAFEEFEIPGDAISGTDPGADPRHLMDLTLLIATLNFAFTDFDTGIAYVVQDGGQTWSDSDALGVKVNRALARGVPITDGQFLAELDQPVLADLLRGDTDLPMLEERVRILNEVGTVLVDRHGGAFHTLVEASPPAMYADGDGLLERLLAEFPRFDDASMYRGAGVQFHKLAQLGLWQMHIALHRSGAWALTDLDRMTAFADYIVPVALRHMEILAYSVELGARVDSGTPIDRDSEEEIEIRAHTLYATAMLTDAVNAIRPPDRQLVIPQIDYRLWKPYHATFSPHHLTRTIMY